MGSRNSVAARRAVTRWAWRMFRREWRQQLLVLTLLTVAVMVAVGSAAVMYHVAVPNEARFGAADARIDLGVSDPQALAADLAAIEQLFGPMEVVGHRHQPIPGSIERVELRSQDPDGAYGAPMLSLVDGDSPAGAGRAAVTEGVAESLQVEVGGRLALDGSEWTVTGLVENPHDLDDEFILVDHSDADPPQAVTVLVGAGAGDPWSRWDQFVQARGDHGTFALPPDEPLTAAIGVLLVTAIGMLLVCLVAGASFTVMAQRRLRQLGMIAAIGATERQTRLATVANGLVVGVVGAAAGTALALLGWLALAPRLEGIAGHRIDPLHLPWWTVVVCAVLAVTTAPAAAWWPARALARIPILRALSGRPPRPRPARRSGAAAAILLVLGVALLALAGQTRPGPDDDWQGTGPWQLALIFGVVTTVVGILSVSPLAIRVLAAAGSRAPIVVRLALRDLGRYRARSAAALAAITLGLAVAVFFVVAAAAAAPAGDEGNLSDRHLMVRVGDRPGVVPVRTPAELAELEGQVDRIAGRLADPTVVPLAVAVEPDAVPAPDPDGGEGGYAAVRAGWDRAGHRYLDEPLYVATPELLAYLGVDPGAVDPNTEILSVHPPEDLRLRYGERRGDPEPVPDPASLDIADYSSAPRSLITIDALNARGWRAERAGWLVEAGQPLTSGQVAAARDVSAGAGLTVEQRRSNQDLTLIGWGMTAAAVVLSLGILAMTIGLIRGESTRDLRVLAAAGATGRVRRTLTAVTAGALALAGAVLATACVYLVLGLFDPADLTTVPVLHLTVIVAGIPLAAMVGGWLLSGREPPALARAAME